MDLTLIQGAISGMKTASDIAKAILELKSMTDVQGKVIELQSAILSAQSSALSANVDQAAMAEEIRQLRERIEALARWGEERKRYRLVRPFDGAVVYGLRASMADGDPPHWICTKCYEDGRKVILNPKENPKGSSLLSCPTCKAEIVTPWRNAPEPAYAAD